jgi:hypothetical protein
LAALTVEPVCLKIMPPAFTGWPPYTFTPRRFDSESLPFFVEPAPFLCAASITKPLRGAHNGLQLLTDAPAKALARMLVANMMSAAVFFVVVLDSRQRNQRPLSLDRFKLMAISDSRLQRRRMASVVPAPPVIVRTLQLPFDATSVDTIFLVAQDYQ